jgi:putative restriction endonuclease
VLEAAHIQPYAAGGRHSIQNGLLLRSDLHTLFDRGYVTVTPEAHLEVSRRIREEFENGHEYYALHGRDLRLPKQPDSQPAPDLLRWHNENVFLG